MRTTDPGYRLMITLLARAARTQLHRNSRFDNYVQDLSLLIQSNFELGGVGVILTPLWGWLPWQLEHTTLV